MGAVRQISGSGISRSGFSRSERSGPGVAGLLALAMLALPPMLLPGRARAQDMTRSEIALQNQVLELRHDLDALSAKVAAGGGKRHGGSMLGGADTGGSGTGGAGTGGADTGGAANGAAGSDLTATLLDRVSRLEDQVRSLSGQMDDLRNSATQNQADLSKQISDLNFRVQTLEGGATPGGVGAGATNPGAAATPAPTLTPVKPGPAKPGPAKPGPAAAPSLARGEAALARHDYKAAEQTARDLIDAHLHGYEARFLLARALAGERAFQPAALAYNDLYTAQKTGPHAQDGLLGLGRMLADLSDKPAACATLDKLRLEFPAARADVKSASAALAHRLSCH